MSIIDMKVLLSAVEPGVSSLMLMPARCMLAAVEHPKRPCRSPTLTEVHIIQRSKQ
jgi:hypothetical protein